MKALALAGLTISEIVPLIRKKQISPLELTKSYLDRIKKLNPTLNAYLALTEEDAIAAARKAERDIAREITAGRSTAFHFLSRITLPLKA